MVLKFNILDKNIDRQSFDCGVLELNDFIQTKARQQQSKGFNRTFVLIDTNDSSFKALGYYTLSMGEVSLESLPEDKKKKLPKHPVPVARIGRLAVDNSMKRKGLGEKLLVDALKRVQRASQEVGVYAVVVDAKNEEAKNFYKRYGFIQFENSAMTLFIPLSSLPK